MAQFYFETYLLLAIFIIITTITSSTVIKVHDVHGLQFALKKVVAGDTIELADGEYHGFFKNVPGVSGNSEQPISLLGSKKAVLSSWSYGIHLENTSHWILKGFTIKNSKKGVMMDNCSHFILEDLEIHDIEDEGVHFRHGSSDNTLINSFIHNTGIKQPGFGEAVYVGSVVGNWLGGKPDHSDRNRILNNRLGPNVAAEEIDIKEGTCCGLISGNTFDGTGMSGENFADSWIDLKGDKWTVENNTGVHSIKDGIQVHHQKKALEGLLADGRGLLGGCGNVIKSQKCADIKGKCVAVEIANSTVLKANDCVNKVEG